PFQYARGAITNSDTQEKPSLQRNLGESAASATTCFRSVRAKFINDAKANFGGRGPGGIVRDATAGHPGPAVDFLRFKPPWTHGGFLATTTPTRGTV